MTISHSIFVRPFNHKTQPKLLLSGSLSLSLFSGYYLPPKAMAFLLFKDKKGANLPCASPASAAVCTSLERRSMVRPSIGRAVDMYSKNARRPRASKHLNASKNKSDSHNYNRTRTAKQNSTEFASPAGSSRYLLNDSSFHFISEIDNSKAIVLAEKRNPESEIVNQEEIEVLKACSSARHDQVVVLRVSLHCKGCEGKVRKHISKMEDFSD